MRNCAFLTIEDAGEYVIDDELAVAPLAMLNWNVTSIPWNRKGVSWDAFDAVVIRSCWDYHVYPLDFLRVLGEIESSGARLMNSRNIVEWNLNKTYLRDLSDRGIDTVPTVWRNSIDSNSLARLFVELNSESIIIKPEIGASAFGVVKVHRDDPTSKLAGVLSAYKNRPFLAQPFLKDVEDPGEFSVFFMDGQYSHTILKTPKTGDFRVQEELGGSVRSMVADDDLIRAASRVMAALDTHLLYARVDLIAISSSTFETEEAPEGTFLLMELELIEPSLFLRLDPSAPERFARAIDARFQTMG